MVSTLQDYALNPIYLFYYYGAHNDFRKNGRFNVAYFVVNIILSLIISFFGCVYNEFILFFFCGFERDTHDQVSKRADIKISDIQMQLTNIKDDNLSNDDDESVDK